MHPPLSFSISTQRTNPKPWGPLLRELRKTHTLSSPTLLLIQGGSKVSRQKIADQIAGKLHRSLVKATSRKYIGETEKNLIQLINRASVSNQILFFDEADALFGRRTSRGGTVKDSHDRYANLETNHLKKRLEKYPGIIIALTTGTDTSKFSQLPGKVIRISIKNSKREQDAERTNL